MATPSPSEPTRELSATLAKNAFGKLLDRVMAGERVVITRHDTPKAVLLSYEEYQRLAGHPPVLDSLRAEFDALLDRMQNAKTRAGLRAAFQATPAELGRAAVNAARAARVPARRRRG